MASSEKYCLPKIIIDSNRLQENVTIINQTVKNVIWLSARIEQKYHIDANK